MTLNYVCQGHHSGKSLTQIRALKYVCQDHTFKRDRLYFMTLYNTCQGHHCEKSLPLIGDLEV